ncbi:MAG: hypothetical protein SPL42_09245 [Bacteroidales bacterium]|nr:hypothetical protein [Bacteroidales bacterium]
MASNKSAPIGSLEDIAARKRQLQAKIELQERKLSRDLDAYQDDIDTFKKVWNGVKSVRNAGEVFSFSSIANVARALPIGKSRSAGGGSKLLTAVTLGAELVSWIIKRRKERKTRKKL